MDELTTIANMAVAIVIRRNFQTDQGTTLTTIFHLFKQVFCWISRQTIVALTKAAASARYYPALLFVLQHAGECRHFALIPHTRQRPLE